MKTDQENIRKVAAGLFLLLVFFFSQPFAGKAFAGAASTCEHQEAACLPKQESAAKVDAVQKAAVKEVGEPASDCDALVEAVLAQDISRIKELLMVVDPNCIREVEAETIQNGKVIDTPVGNPRTALVAAARLGNLAIGKMLVAAGAKVAFHAAGDETPLMAASAYGHLPFVQYLVQQQAAVNIRLSGEGTALLKAARNGQLDVVRYLRKQGAEVNAYVSGDGTPLVAAASNGHTEVVKYLLQEGAKANQVAPGDGTPLIGAVRNGHLETARLLLEHGADANLPSPGDEYPLYHAREAKNRAMIQLLESYAKK